MSVIIRLQNLPWSANALDIRQFFHGLCIPEGGVHIVGGEQGDAFIAFSTDEDARQAFSRNNSKLKEVQVSLMLSSRTEMQKVIEAARTQSYAAFMQAPATAAAPLPAIVPSLIPAAVPELKKSTSKEREGGSTAVKSEKRDRKRSRSRSRERKGRREKRDRDRDRSRTRSRERRERRRRERSRSRGRSRSKERERKTRDRRRSDDHAAGNPPRTESTRKVNNSNNDAWMNQNSNDTVQSVPQTPSLMSGIINFGGPPIIVEDHRPNLSHSGNGGRNGFASNSFGGGGGGGRSRDSWPPINVHNDNMSHSDAGFIHRSDNMGRQNNNGSNMANSFQNRRFPRNNFTQLPDNHQYNNNNNMMSDRPEREVVPNCCVKIQPIYGGYGDIRRFFHRAFISNVGIKFINDEYGHRTGMVYVQFGNLQGKHDALLKHGASLNGVNVDVIHIDDIEFDEAVDRFKPDNYSQDSDDSRSQQKFRSKNITKYFNTGDDDLKDYTSLIVDDLPTYVKEQDILKMFSPLPLTSLILTTKQRGGHIAYIRFSSAEDAKKAFDEKSSHIVEGKAVTVRPCDDNEFEEINQQHDVDLDRKQPTPLVTDCISMTRLPQQTNNVEISDFFSDIGIRPMKIHLMSNRLGFTGQAFCEFASSEEADKALKKDGTSFGPNHVLIQAFSRDEMEQILQQTLSANHPNNQQLPPEQQQPQQQSLLNRPLFNMNQMNQHNRPYYPRNNSYDGNGMQPRRGGGGNGGGVGNRYMGQMGGMGGRPRFMNMNPAPQEEAPPGCTVFMDNVPYKAGTNEILDFFDGYDITNNVCRRYNPNNTPSAEAKVVFSSPEEAYRAVTERSGQKIWERPIFLKQL